MRSFVTRRSAIAKTVATGLGLTISPRVLEAIARISQGEALVTKPIPSSGERLPVIGIGTARRYDVAGSPAELDPLREVVRRFPTLGGKVIDTAPGYGRAEEVVGSLVNDVGNRDALFLATKVSVRSGDVTDGKRSLDQSLARLHTRTIDCLQVHNLGGTRVLLPWLRELKGEKRIRYFGITTSFDRQYEEFEQVMRSEAMDVIQVDYAIDNRGAADRILPLAADRGMAVLVNLPFGRTSVFQKVQGTSLPAWAKEIDCASWAQVFLKYIVSHPSVTCAIPGTAKVEYLLDNIAAARGRMPDGEMRHRIERYFDSL